MTKAFNIAQGIPWAITEAGLRQVLTIANRENLDLAAVEARRAERLDQTASVGIRDGVAIVPVIGPIVRYANLFSSISGATSIDILARDFTAALNNTAVRAILLHIDSPGGEVNGVAEFAAMVYAARGVKPITAYVGGLGASAAYWIASAADSIVCDATAILGSIGVIAAVPDPAYESAGDVTFVSSQSPRKNPDPTTDEGKSDIQGTIDALASVFVETVARNRGVSVATVLSDFGQGGVFVGADAVNAGLADRLGAYEETLAGLCKEATRGASTQADVSLPNALDPALADEFHAASKYTRENFSRSSAPLASRPARVHTNTTKETIHMADEIQEGIEASALPPIVPPTFNAADPAVTAQVNAVVAQMTAQFEQQRQIVLEQAQAQFQRQLAEMQAQQQISSYAQHATTPTLQRQHALPIEAGALTSFLSSLSATQRTAATGLFDRILDAGLVSFEEIGSQQDGPAEQSAQEQYDAAVQAKMAGGMARLAAMQAVAKEQPNLYASYQAESSRRGKVAK